jgi:transcriptional regulator with XRE-family HTH domain
MSNIKKSLKLGGKIKTARKQAGLSQKQLAKMIGVSDKAVSAYEVGRAQPPVPVLREISNVTYKPVNFFVDEIEVEEIGVTARIAKIEHELMEIKKMLASQQLEKVEQETEVIPSDTEKLQEIE